MIRTILGLSLIAGITCCQGKAASEVIFPKHAVSYDIDAKDLDHDKDIRQVDGLWGVAPSGHHRPERIVESKGSILVPKGARVRVEMWHKARAYGSEKNVEDFGRNALFTLWAMLEDREANTWQSFQATRSIGDLFAVIEILEWIEIGDKVFLCSDEKHLHGISAEAVAPQDSYLSFHVDGIGPGGGVFIKNFIIDIL